MSHLGASAFGALAKGKSAQFVMPPDTPHDFAYVPDIARAIVTLLDATDDAYGQAWNMPCAPTRTPRDILRLGAEAIHVKLKIMAVPLWMLPAIGLVMPFMREVADVSFTLDRPYRVDATKFVSSHGPARLDQQLQRRSLCPAKRKACLTMNSSDNRLRCRPTCQLN